MKVSSQSFENGQVIPKNFAFCKIDAEQHCIFSDNKNPELNWSDFPAETKSFAIICYDPDVPSVGDDVNQEGKSVSKDLPRVDFFHWVLVNIKANVTNIEEGSVSEGVSPRGKQAGMSDLGVTGVNDYTNLFAGDPDMGGFYGGYDGPCPPWNDEIIHHYHFVVYALDTEYIDIKGHFKGQSLRDAIKDHIIDQAEIVGTYTLNPNLR